jgi:hypothetical protein
MIQEAIDSGAVAAHKRARRLLVNAGSFYDWLGEPVPVYPEWGFEYDVRPDDEDIAPLKKRFDGLREALQQSPAGIDLPSSTAKLERLARFGDEATSALTQAIQAGFVTHWQELSAIDVVVAEVTEEFAGEDPLIPALRSVLDGLKEMLDGLRESMASAGIEVNLPETDPELIDQVRGLVRRDLGELTLTIRA